MAELRSALSDEEKSLLLSRYSELEFVDDVSEFLCGRCHQVAIDHYYTTNCKHVFCRSCKTILGDGKTFKWKCPVCSEFLTEISHQDINFEERVNALTVKCPNKIFGCQYINCLKDTAKHMMTCRYTDNGSIPVNVDHCVAAEKGAIAVNADYCVTADNGRSCSSSDAEGKSLAYSWKLKNVEKLMKKKVFECESDSFPFHEYHFGARAKLAIKENDTVCVSICFIDVNNTGQPMRQNVIPEVTTILRDRSGGNENKDRARDASPSFSSSLRYGYYYGEKTIALKRQLLNSPYFIDSSIVIDILVEPPALAHSSFSQDGIMTWKIDNYQEKLEREREGLVLSQLSPYFYTGPKGYRVRVKVGLNGYGKYNGKGPTALISFVTGEFDASLPSKFKHTTTFIVFNQKNPENYLIKSAEQNIAQQRYYYMDIAPHSEITNGGFLLNNTLMCRLEIRPK